MNSGSPYLEMHYWKLRIVEMHFLGPNLQIWRLSQKLRMVGDVLIFIKDSNIGKLKKHGYIGYEILQIYQKYR